MNVRKSKVVRISRQPSAMQIVEYFSYLGSRITNDARCALDIKSRTVMATAAFSEKKALLTSKLDLHLRKKPVKRYIWSIALCGAGTGTVREVVDQKYVKRCEMCCWRRTEKISCTACVKGKEEVLHRVKEESNIAQTVISHRQ